MMVQPSAATNGTVRTAPGLRRAAEHVRSLARLQRNLEQPLNGPTLLTVAALQLEIMAEKAEASVAIMIDTHNDPDVLAVKLALLNSMPNLTGQQINDVAIYAVFAIRERATSPHAASLIEGASRAE